MAFSIALRLPSPSSTRLDPNPNRSRVPSKASAFLSAFGLPSRRLPPPSLFRCRNARSDSQTPSGGGRDESGGGGKRWDELIQDMVASAVKRWDDYVKSYRSSSQSEHSEGLGSEKASDFRVGEEIMEVEEEESGGDWDWDRWKRHFAEMEDQERIVSVLKICSSEKYLLDSDLLCTEVLTE